MYKKALFSLKCLNKEFCVLLQFDNKYLLFVSLNNFYEICKR